MRGELPPEGFCEIASAKLQSDDDRFQKVQNWRNSIELKAETLVAYASILQMMAIWFV